MQCRGRITRHTASVACSCGLNNQTGTKAIVGYLQLLPTKSFGGTRYFSRAYFHTRLIIKVCTDSVFKVPPVALQEAFPRLMPIQQKTSPYFYEEEKSTLNVPQLCGAVKSELLDFIDIPLM